MKTAVLISGRGSNMMALLDAAKSPDHPAEITLVISNRPEALGLEKADARGIKAICIDHRDFDTRKDFEQELHAALIAHDIEFIACAGFMRVLTGGFVAKWEGRMINIHPSLLPKYKGLHTHARAIEAGDTEHGCSVHWVAEGVDTGAVIAQAKIEILPDDNPDTLAARILVQELDLYPAALAKAIRALS
ncbi:phosphoribosylglycinamide formyltransferase [Litorimonas sp. RW-G-Af-16]|uniref:phosphoribosylglycinamide formyltransferase n=1 Tax=Litorimonas sp. RW-G-Af-16 TaxID=3241168 RepID=UPI003AACA1F9